MVLLSSLINFDQKEEQFKQDDIVIELNDTQKVALTEARSSASILAGRDNSNRRAQEMNMVRRLL